MSPSDTVRPPASTTAMVCAAASCRLARRAIQRRGWGTGSTVPRSGQVPTTTSAPSSRSRRTAWSRWRTAVGGRTRWVTSLAPIMIMATSGALPATCSTWPDEVAALRTDDGDDRDVDRPVGALGDAGGQHRAGRLVRCLDTRARRRWSHRAPPSGSARRGGGRRTARRCPAATRWAPRSPGGPAPPRPGPGRRPRRRAGRGRPRRTPRPSRSAGRPAPSSPPGRHRPAGHTPDARRELHGRGAGHARESSGPVTGPAGSGVVMSRPQSEARDPISARAAWHPARLCSRRSA